MSRRGALRMFVMTWLAVFALPLLLVAGDGSEGAEARPSEASVVGKWVPDRQVSNCSKLWMADDTALVMNAGGSCEVRNFGKGFFQKNYSAEYDQGTRGEVAGKWEFVRGEGKWALRFEFKVPTGTLVREARLLRIRNEIVIEFWLGWPDTSPRLILVKGR